MVTIPEVSRKMPSFLALVVAALVVSSCYASRQSPAGAGPNGIVIQDDPKCEVMLPCGPNNCVPYCQSIGLKGNAWCTSMPDMQIYCCCRVGA
ncbi:hypothetical protein EJB05_19246, partial [Eragrostis curvula]